jgi:hypothetical protein
LALASPKHTTILHHWILISSLGTTRTLQNNHWNYHKIFGRNQEASKKEKEASQKKEERRNMATTTSYSRLRFTTRTTSPQASHSATTG